MIVKIKKAKGTKKCIIKKLKFESYKNLLEATQLDNNMKYLQNLIKFTQIILNDTKID